MMKVNQGWKTEKYLNRFIMFCWSRLPLLTYQEFIGTMRRICELSNLPYGYICGNPIRCQKNSGFRMLEEDGISSNLAIIPVFFRNCEVYFLSFTVLRTDVE